MNKDRRRRLDEALSALRSIGEEEREAFDNMPEALQEGERGQHMVEIADGIESACDDIEALLN